MLILLAVISASHKSALSRNASLEFSDAFILTWRLAFATLYTGDPARKNCSVGFIYALNGPLHSKVSYISRIYHFSSESSASREAKRPPPLKISGKETRSRSLARSI